MIKTERLNLQHSSIDYADFLFELMNSRDWIKYIGDRGIDTVEDARKYITNKQLPQLEKLGFGNYVVCIGDTPIGNCGIYRREGLEYGDLGFAFLEAYYNKGYAYEAAMAVMEDGYKNHNLNLIQAITLPINKPSIRLLEKLGFEYKEQTRIPNDDEELLLYQIELKNLFS